MAKQQFLDSNGLTELAKHIPQLVAGTNITLTPDATKSNKITISSSGGGEVPEYTKAEYEANKDSIPEGTQFIITDDYVEGGGAGGHEMYNSISELPTDEDGFIDIPVTDTHVLSAHAITEIANKKTYRIIIDALATEQGGTGIGTWCEDTVNYSTTDSDDWIGARTGEEDIASLLQVEDNDEDVEVSFLFETDNNEPIYMGGYQWDNTLGRICIKFGNRITKNGKVAIDITRLTKMN